MGVEPATDIAYTVIEFNTEDTCYLVNHLMQDHGMNFHQAVDYAELREGTHWWVKRHIKKGEVN